MSRESARRCSGGSCSTLMASSCSLRTLSYWLGSSSSTVRERSADFCTPSTRDCTRVRASNCIERCASSSRTDLLCSRNRRFAVLDRRPAPISFACSSNDLSVVGVKSAASGAAFCSASSCSFVVLRRSWERASPTATASCCCWTRRKALPTSSTACAAAAGALVPRLGIGPVARVRCSYVWILGTASGALFRPVLGERVELRHEHGVRENPWARAHEFADRALDRFDHCIDAGDS
jgi:hypothetical protein